MISWLTAVKSKRNLFGMAAKFPKLHEEFQYYLDHQASLVEEYAGKHIVIIGKEVVGSYESTLEAYEATIKGHAPGTFLIQHCLPGVDNYSQTFHHYVRV